ncbi:MAG: hypothetical protein EZS28_011531 [Streblomastix strix]|uniref:Uncharacterized protein n=1 Tax=Streblomastix strix TaxID=222440 RepID=A0A5J4WDD0_9EUKA|nr:MAG: hypothetical protein EZS28_011531 [Streblomastix strix]
MKKDRTANQLLLANGETSDIGDFLPKQYPHALGQMIIEPNDDIRNQGLRIQKQEDEAYDYKRLIIDFDCTSLKFNNQVITPLSTPPIEYATQQVVGIGVFDFFTWGKTMLLNKRVYISMAPTTITWHNTLADLNRYRDRQAQKNMVFLLCLMSLTK